MRDLPYSVCKLWSKATQAPQAMAINLLRLRTHRIPTHTPQIATYITPDRYLHRVENTPDSNLHRALTHRIATYIATYTRRRRGKEKRKTGRGPASRPRGTAGGKTGCARGRDREDKCACRPTGLRLNLMRRLHAYTAALPLVDNSNNKACLLFG